MPHNQPSCICCFAIYGPSQPKLGPLGLSDIRQILTFKSYQTTYPKCTLVQIAENGGQDEQATADVLASSDVLVSRGAKQMLAQAAASCAAELSSLRSVVHVLASAISSLGNRPNSRSSHSASGTTCRCHRSKASTISHHQSDICVFSAFAKVSTV